MSRDILTSDRIYYVRPDGSNSNSGLVDSPSGAFQTVQYAVNHVGYRVDPVNFNITIQLAPGTYSEDVELPFHIGSKILIINGTSTYGEVVVKSFLARGSRRWRLKDLEVNNPSGSFCVSVYRKGYIGIQNVQFNACTFSHVNVRYGSEVAFGGNYRIVGDSARHLFVQSGSKVRYTSLECTLVGTRAFSTYFAGAGINAILRTSNTTFVGSATGTRYLSAANSVITGTGGSATFFPGNVAGSSSEGGIYG